MSARYGTAARRVRKADPAPKAMDLHEEKLGAIVKAASALVLDAGRQMRDELDDVLELFSEENERLHDQIAAYVHKSEAIFQAFVIMRESLGSAKKQMASPAIIEPKQ